MLQQPLTTSQDIPSMLHLILKAYRTTIVINLSPHQQSAESLVPWGQLLFAVVNLRLPKEILPEDVEEREKSEWWKAKKWAYAVLGRLFHRCVAFNRIILAQFVEFVEFSQGTGTPLRCRRHCKRNTWNLPNISSPHSPRKS